MKNVFGFFSSYHRVWEKSRNIFQVSTSDFAENSGIYNSFLLGP